MSTIRTRTRAYVYDEIFYEHATSRKKSDGMMAGLDVFFGARPYEPIIHDSIAYGNTTASLRDLLVSGAIDAYDARGCAARRPRRGGSPTGLLPRARARPRASRRARQARSTTTRARSTRPRTGRASSSSSRCGAFRSFISSAVTRRAAR